VSFRLVAGQSPETVLRLVHRHVEAHAPPGVAATVVPVGGIAHPWRAEDGNPFLGAARRALAAAFGREPVAVGMGGSLPVLREIQDRLGAPVLLLGFGLPEENAHAPDEWLDLENFRRGGRASARLWDELAAVWKGP
jgi:acetylornithine deacetylase/succinyl-diaminopimelate desuccinylase-like protein